VNYNIGEFMTAEVKTIRISIESKEFDQRRIPAAMIADVFQKIQNVLYYIIDHLEGNPPRLRGDFPSAVKEHGELVISGINIGSITAELSLSETQSCLPGTMTYGERAIAIADEAIDAISAEDAQELKLLDAIGDERTANRVLRELDSIWPDERSKYSISIGFGKDGAHNLDPKHKPVVRSILNKPLERSEKEILGRMMELRVDQKRVFQIDTPEGIVACQYSRDIVEKVVENIGNLIRVRGIMTLQKNGRYTLCADDENSIERLQNLPLPKIKLLGQVMRLKEPLQLNILYEDDRYIISHDGLNLLVVSSSLKEGVEGINEELEILWDDYVKSSAEELSHDAIELRNRMISMLEKEDADGYIQDS